MSPIIRRSFRAAAFAAIVGVVAACSSISSMVGGGGIDKVTLNGASETPPVATSASGTGSIMIAQDGSVSGSVTVTGMTPTMAHIHQGAPGVAGPVIVPFKQDGNTFTATPGAKLTESQMAAWRAGNLYFNVHSAAHPAGEIRGQLKAPS